jgi:ABC-type transporter Mla subunit MlaD
MRLPPIPGPRDVVQLIDRVTGLLASAEQLVSDAGELIARIEQTRSAADDVVARTDTTVTRADDLIGQLEPSLTQLQPTLERLAETTEPHEVDALVALVDQLPLLAAKLETDVIPVLNTLTSVAPDLHDLLDVSRELNEMLAKLPGMGIIKKRVDEEQDLDPDDRVRHRREEGP